MNSAAEIWERVLSILKHNLSLIHISEPTRQEAIS